MGHGFCLNRRDVTVLTGLSVIAKCISTIKIALSKEEHEAEDIFDLVGSERCHFTDEFAVESDGPGCVREDIV